MSEEEFEQYQGHYNVSRANRDARREIDEESENGAKELFWFILFILAVGMLTKYILTGGVL